MGIAHVKIKLTFLYERKGVKNMKKIVVLLLTVTMCLGVFVGCGGSSGLGGSPKIDIDDINWEIKEGVVNGNRWPTFNYTNNTDYDIISLKLDFVVRDDVSESDLNANSKIVDKSNKQNHTVSEFTINVIDDEYTEKGGSSENISISLDGTIEALTDMNVAELMQADMMTIAFLAGDEVYVAYYDYKNEEMTYEKDSTKAVTWSEKDLAKTISKPDAPVIVVTADSDNRFSARACNYTKDEFEKYVNDCKEKGYDVDVEEKDRTDSSSFEAKNKDDLKLEVTYDSSTKMLKITLNK